MNNLLTEHAWSGQKNIGLVLFYRKKTYWSCLYEHCIQLAIYNPKKNSTSTPLYRAHAQSITYNLFSKRVW